jgi:SAM-dependent methyltransferase
MNRPRPNAAEAEAGSLRQAVGAGAEAPKWKQIGRLFTDWQFASRVVRKRLGLPVAMETEDRRVLENIIFPYYLSDPNVKSVLFVGCDWYTRHYQRFYFSNVDYWTIEPAAERRKFGAKRHVVAPLENLDAHFSPQTFDLIVCNGVYGWGLNSREQCESAFAQCYSRLRDGGHLMLGWDDIPERTPVPLAEIASLNRFRRHDFPSLGSWRYLTDTPYRHTYNFYRK